ncbi:hypothetical protein PGT21_012576 [Puccinia graminis f. sp. tritici]|uniref:Uncharacterized protein n=1 Tax=Puccinia graminis f. sp. tritici TaxID=56615 RepID=A0A5B0QA98_PUCGR|nr:hypothetical protein PGT21_012576 [Puccinia graminis f. sp. tritici]
MVYHKASHSGPQRHLTFPSSFRYRATKSKAINPTSKFPFLANRRPSSGSPSSSSTLNPSSGISIADWPSNTNSPRFSANGPPSSHDPSNNIFSMDLFNSLSPSS